MIPWGGGYVLFLRVSSKPDGRESAMAEFVADHVAAVLQRVAKVDWVEASRPVVVETFMLHVCGIGVGIERIGVP